MNTRRTFLATLLTLPFFKSLAFASKPKPDASKIIRGLELQKHLSQKVISDCRVITSGWSNVYIPQFRIGARR